MVKYKLDIPDGTMVGCLGEEMCVTSGMATAITSQHFPFSSNTIAASLTRNCTFRTFYSTSKYYSL